MAIWRDPLVHFLLAGAVLFGAYALLDHDESPSPEAIVVDRDALLTFLQFRANAFEPETFGAALDAMTDAELEELIDAYVTEEIFYREAVALGLEQSDNIIRQRMVQKMNFLIADSASPAGQPDAAALRSFFEDNIEAYAVQPWATFTHVFFDATERGEDGALAAAQAAVETLNGTGVTFDGAPRHGDDFPFLRNYVERTLEYVAGHFGYAFSEQLQTLAPSADTWQGPIASVFGQHVVLLIERVERTYPSLDDVRDDVARDLGEQAAAAGVAELGRALREQYDIRIEPIRRVPAE